MKSKNYSLAIIFSLCLLFSGHLIGQEMNGLTFSGYGGITSAIQNPALLTGSKVFMDINLVGANATASNDIAYFLPENRTISKFLTMDSLQLNDGNFKYNRSYNYFDNTDQKYLSSNFRVMGPSLMLQYEHHAFGLSTSIRSMHSGNNIPYEMPMIMYEGLHYEAFHGKEYDDYNYGFVSMTWSEIALSYAYDMINYYDNKFTVGITVKGILGHEAGYVAIDHANFIVQNKDDVEFIDLDAEIGFSLPYDSKTGAIDIEPLVRGYGAGVDVGFVFTKKESIFDHQGYRKLCTKPYQDYKFKFGLSILDIGSVVFSQKTELHEFEDASSNWVKYDTTRFSGFGETLRKYSDALYGDPDASYAGDRITIGLPTAVSMQFDYKMKEKYYLSAMWIQPLRFNLHSLWRPAQVAVIPRYETRYVGVSLPLSLYNYSEPRIGLAVRFYSLTIGTDRLGALVGMSKFTGADIYFSLKFNIEQGVCWNLGGYEW